ncbi:uncharacterized protein LOC136085324 [Hydra vulgaris]|uniref:Uncharacterized protein LOC136085324 n=1 Tax=Hydra vulgaris TaxID=6087 RepID=A0ABM4CLN3_HYDVU
MTESSFENYLCPINKSHYSSDKYYYNNEYSSELSHGKLDIAFKSLKRNKPIGADEVSGNIVVNCYESLKDILYKVFNASIKQGVFPDQLKIAKVIPIYKQGDKTNINNYRPILVLSTFSKLLERIIYKRIFKYFDQNNLLYFKQFGFKKHISTGHAVIQFVREISESFEKKQYTLGVFIDLSKAFDIVGHKILLSDMNKELKCVSEWFNCNKLTLNLDKTKYILFHPISKKRFLPTTMPKILIDELEIKKETFTSFLGIYLDENVTWKPHIDYICTKVSKNIGVLHKSRNYFNKTILIQLYYSFLHRYINYANIAWGSTSKSKLRTLYHRQKHAIRLV